MAPHPPTHSTSLPPRLSFCIGRPQCEMPYEVRFAAGKDQSSASTIVTGVADAELVRAEPGKEGCVDSVFPELPFLPLNSDALQLHGRVLGAIGVVVDSERVVDNVILGDGAI
eukprot:scaffold1564_cov24-Phaeocystis_antarctica.AAC.1